MNTNFVKNYRSYQLCNVSMQLINALTFLVLQKVYKKINRNSNEGFVFFRKWTECKLFEEYDFLIGDINRRKLLPVENFV